ncbi:MAG: rod shape-determining protein MreD [Candidatus Omnitrophica bacterium]|nr:rod shape-determining protein MreD [Candidatus Omnitrophota bacterium]MDD5513700.1 rod shape-determining protein MreD [Candidatus Omnitrophota bacterium]
MNKRTILLVIPILALLEATLLNYFRIFSVKPDLLLISAIACGLSLRLKWALPAALLAGILKDLLCAGSTLCLNSLVFPVLCLSVYFLRKKVSLGNELAKTLLVFIAVILSALAGRALNLAFFGGVVPTGITLRIIFLESLYTAGVSYLYFRMKHES